MTTTAVDQGLAAAFDNVVATESGFSESNIPPAGHVGQLVVIDAKLGQKDGEYYFVVEYRDGVYEWSEFKWITKGGQGHAGRKTSVSILLKSLGYVTENVTIAFLQASCSTLPGRNYTYEQVAASQINAATGMPYVNTNILGQAQAPQPAAVAAEGVARGASFGDDIPWDQAPPMAAPAPANAITAG